MSSARGSWSGASLPGETGPTGGPAHDRRARDVPLLGRRRLRRAAGPDRTARRRSASRSRTSSPASRCRRGRRRGCGSSRRTPRSGRWRSGRTWRPGRWASWLLRRSATSTARRANSVLAMTPSGRRRTTTRRWSRSTRASGQRPIAAVLPDSAEDAMFRSHGWVLESHDEDTVFEIAGVAQARRSLAGASLQRRRRAPRGRRPPGHRRGAHRRRPAPRLRASRRTPTTGSASAASRSTRPSAAAASGC